MNRPNFKQQLQGLEPSRTAIPQAGPFAATPEPPAPAPPADKPASGPNRTHRTPRAVAATSEPHARVQPASQPRVTPLVVPQPSELKLQYTSWMFASMHRLLKDMSYREDRKHWQIIHDALYDYAATHHPDLLEQEE